MSEREIYEQTNDQAPEKIMEACDQVADFIAHFDYKKFTSVDRDFYISDSVGWNR